MDGIEAGAKLAPPAILSLHCDDNDKNCDEDVYHENYDDEDKRLIRIILKSFVCEYGVHIYPIPLGPLLPESID